MYKSRRRKCSTLARMLSQTFLINSLRRFVKLNLCQGSTNLFFSKVEIFSRFMHAQRIVQFLSPYIFMRMIPKTNNENQPYCNFRSVNYTLSRTRVACVKDFLGQYRSAALSRQSGSFRKQRKSEFCYFPGVRFSMSN